MRSNINNPHKQLPPKITPDPEGTTVIITLRDVIEESGDHSLTIEIDPGRRLEKISVAQIVGYETMEGLTRIVDDIARLGKKVTKLNREGQQ